MKYTVKDIPPDIIGLRFNDMFVFYTEKALFEFITKVRDIYDEVEE